MTRIDAELGGAPVASDSTGWREIWRNEDWWAIWLGLGLVIAGYLLFTQGSSIKWIALTPARWSGDASVRGDDGHCRRHDRYLGADACCADFRSRLCADSPR